MSTSPSLSTKLSDDKHLRQMMGLFPTGVTIVTVGGDHPHGMTANAFSSISIDPPLVMVCVGRTAVMHHRLNTGLFGVSMLASHQEAVATYFADLSRPLGPEQFDEVEWEPGPLTGVPLIEGSLARFECELWQTYDGGDHTIFVGRLLSLDRPVREPGEALLFYQGRFRKLQPERSEVRR